MLFHRCFGIRISSPFHLDTLNIPIQNTKCPENAKNEFPRTSYFPPPFFVKLSDVFDSSASNEKICKECRTLFCVNCIAQSEENIQLKQLNALVLIFIGTSNQ